MVLPKKKPRDEAGLTDRRCSGIQIVTAGRSSSVGAFTRMCVWYVWCWLLTVLVSVLLHEIDECLDALFRTCVVDTGADLAYATVAFPVNHVIFSIYF